MARIKQAIPPSKAPASWKPVIHATSQQSRFHTETLDTSLEIDLHDVSIAIGEKELLTDCHLRLKEGVKYGLIGRNGSGKSTLLQAIADKLIPGIGRSIRILLLSQVEDSNRSLASGNEDHHVRCFGDSNTPSQSSFSVLQHVIRGDVERLRAVHELDMLTKAVETSSIKETQTIIYTLRLEARRSELQEARKIAMRRSGARGKEARLEEIKAEENLKQAEELLADVNNVTDLEVVSRAVDMLNDVQVRLDLLETSTTEARASITLIGLGFSQEMMDSPFASLSGGWRSRCSLAISLIIKSDVLLLDEPSNFLDLEAILWLEQFLRTEERTIVLISHDQEFLNNVVEETIILRHQKLSYFEGTPSACEVNEKKERRRAIGAQEALDRKKEHVEKSIKDGIASAKRTGDENRQRMVKSRQKKLDERWGVETSAKGTRFKLNRDMAGYFISNRAAIAIEEVENKVKIKFPQPEKLRTLGDLIHFDNVEYRFAKSKQPFLSEITFTVEQGGRCSFVGANGQGKSTIAKLIMGELLPTKGTITRHPLLKIGYFSQHSVEELTLPISTLSLDDRPATALSHVMDHFEKKDIKVTEQEIRACLGSFGLQGEVASETPLTALSGGQKVRLALAIVLFRPPAMLLLDEVTTHVDWATVQALARALRSFSGGIVLITHDRWFNRVVIEGASKKGAFGEGEQGNDSESSSSEDDASSPSQGRTYRVGGGKIRLMEKGITQYVGIVERKLARRQKDTV